LSKQDDQGCWTLEYGRVSNPPLLNGKKRADIEVKKKPSKWVTLRALRVLKRAA